VSWRGQVAGIDGSGECTVINVSGSGLLFSGTADLPEKAVVVLRIRPDSVSLVECAARIAWRQSRGDDTLFGAEIVHISAVDRQALSFALMAA